MKNRHLHSLLRTTFAGFLWLLISTLIFAGTPGDKGRTRAYDPFYRLKANQKTGIISADDVLKSQKQAAQLGLKSGSRLNMDWSPMGPTNMGGPVFSAIFDNRDATGSTIYAGGADGGVWRSTNLGLTWHSLGSSDGNVLRVSCMAQSKGGVIFAGTGQVYSTGYNYGNGLYYSTDGNVFNLVPGTALNAHWLGIAQLASDPRNERMYAATIGGIYYSDNGTDWTTAYAGYATDVCVGNDGTVLAVVGDSVYIARGGDISNFVLLSTGDSLKLPNNKVGWARVAIAPSNPSIMYAAIGQSGLQAGYMEGIYGSEDGGNTWNIIFPANSTYEPYGANGFYYNPITVFPDNPEQILIGSKMMWMGKKVSGEQYYDWELVSNGSTTTSDANYAPNYHHQYSFQPGNNGRMVLSSDGGVTVTTIRAGQIIYQTSTFNLQVAQLNSLSFTYSKDNVMGGALNSGTVVVGAYYPRLVNDPLYGMQIWRDGNNIADEGRTGGSCTWSKIDPLCVVYTNVDSNSSTYRTLRRRELNDLTYDNDPLGSDIGFNYGINMPITFAESFNYSHTQDSVKFFNKSDTLVIQPGTAITATSANAAFPFVYVTPKAIPPRDSIMVPDPIAARFFMYTSKASKKGIYMTKYMLQYSHAAAWYCILKDTLNSSNTNSVTTLSYSSDMNTLWMGTQTGAVYRASNLIMANDSATADQGNPTCIVSNDFYTNTPFINRYISGISVDPNDSKRVMVTLGNYGNTSYVYLSENALDSLPVWRDVTGNLPAAPVLCGIIEMHDKNNAIVGTEWGVFSTSDLSSSSPTWAPDMANIGNTPVTAIAQQTTQAYPMLNYGAVYAATWGLGFYRDTTFLTPVGVDPGPAGNVIRNELKISPNPIHDYATIGFHLNQATSCGIYVYDLNGNLVMGGNLGNKPAGDNTARIDFSSLSTGMYIIRVNNSYGKAVKQ
jgi:hypothetical protein